MGSYSHAIKSALDQGPVSDHNFYRQDEVKYHGSTFFTLYQTYTVVSRKTYFAFLDKNRGIHPIEFVSVSERPPSIRFPPQFRQSNPSFAQHPLSEVHGPSTRPAEVSKLPQFLASSATTISETAPFITVTPRRPPLAEFSLRSKAEPTLKNKLLMQTKQTPKPKPVQKLNSREIDYLYFDNGSLTSSRFRLLYFSSFLLLLLSCSYL